MEDNRLADEKVLALDKVLIEGNDRIIGLHFESGYYGRGGSNNSSFERQVNFDRTLAELDGQPFKEIFGVHVCAIVNDIVYLVMPTAQGKNVISFGTKGNYSGEFGVAYDTMQGFVISPILKTN